MRKRVVLKGRRITIEEAAAESGVSLKRLKELYLIATGQPLILKPKPRKAAGRTDAHGKSKKRG